MADDRTDIIEKLNLYALAVDSQQWDLFDHIFTKDVSAEYTGGLVYQGLEVFKQGFADLHDPLVGSLHVMSNHQVRVKGDEAHSLIYGQYRLIRTMPPGGGDFWEAGGWYDDHWVRTDAGWRIDRRVNRNSWWSGNPFILSADISDGAHAFQLDTLREDVRKGELEFIKAVRAGD